MHDDERFGSDGRLFQPDIMLPAQFFSVLRKQSCRGPEYFLVIAMLEDAIECFQKHRWATDDTGRGLYEEARIWLESDDRVWPFSFENVCGVLGLDTDYVRRGLDRWAAENDARRAKVVQLKTPAAYPLADEPARIAVGRAS